MTLKEFINEYIQPNSLVRVLYKIPVGHKLILNDWDEVSMDWEIVKGEGKYAPYINHKVLGILTCWIRERKYYPISRDFATEIIEKYSKQILINILQDYKK